MKVFYCFDIAIGLSGDASKIKLQWRQKFGSCSVHAKQAGCWERQQKKHRVRFWLFGPRWSSCQKIKMMQCALFYYDLWKH